MKKNKFKIKTNPFAHQSIAIDFVEKEDVVSLFDEQGLGKTKIVIDALCKNFAEKKLNGAIVVCKKTLIKNWLEEIEKHSNLSCTEITGNRKTRQRKGLGFSYFYIIGYESLIRENKMIEELLKIRKMALVLDESHKIKNPEAKITLQLFKLANLPGKKIILSGTPIANKPIDLWAQFFFLDDGKTFGKDFKKFKKEFDFDLKKEVNQSKLKVLKEKIEKISLRRTKGELPELDLPSKKIINVPVILEKDQKEMYKRLKEKLFLEIKDLNGNEIILKAEEIFVKLLRLIQITSNPYLIDKAYDEVPAKFKALDQLILNLTKKKQKVIIWTSFIENISILRKRYSKFNPVMIYGKMTMEKRNASVKKFQNYPEYKILLANPAAAREGLTLTAASNAIYLDRNFNLVDFMQSQDRIHRISQKKNCFIHLLVAKDTIDEYVDYLLKRKEEIAKYIQGDITSYKEGNLLSKEELVELLG